MLAMHHLFLFDKHLINRDKMIPRGLRTSSGMQIR